MRITELGQVSSYETESYWKINWHLWKGLSHFQNIKQNSEVGSSGMVMFKLATIHEDRTLRNSHLTFENKSGLSTWRKYCQEFAQLNRLKLVISKEGVFIKIETLTVLWLFFLNCKLYWRRAPLSRATRHSSSSPCCVLPLCYHSINPALLATNK